MQLVINRSLSAEQNPVEFKETLACVRSPGRSCRDVELEHGENLRKMS